MYRAAVSEGVRLGYEDAAIEQCSGRDDPEERCPMRSEDGCICAYRQYQDLWWWQRMSRAEPKRPSKEAVFEVFVSEAIIASLLPPAAMKDGG